MSKRGNWIFRIVFILTFLFMLNINTISSKLSSIFIENETTKEVLTQEEQNDLNLLKEKVNLSEKTIKYIKYSDFENLINEEKIKAVYYEEKTNELYVRDIDDNFFKTLNPQYETFKKELVEKNIVVLDKNLLYTKESKASSTTETILIISLLSIPGIFILGMIFLAYKEEFDAKKEAKRKKKKKKKSTSENKTKALVNGYSTEETSETSTSPNAKTFDDIAGLREVKKDMKCLVDFIKNKDKYTKAGAKLPKGVILYGPPGTGKTLLAKAVAGEADVPFIYMSGSDFVEMYVGVGAKRVRETFEEAKSKAPCIIFIDEIDAIGGNRNQADSSGEDRKTINALLTEMDGFNASDNVLVIGATNRLEDLDPALVRPGRFTNKYCVPLPSTSKERLEIIKIYTANKKFAEDVDFKALSKETIGFSPAQIEALLNEAAIISVQDDKDFIDKESLEKAMMKILLSGHIKENQKDRDKNELELVAYHEAGHALIGKLLGKKVSKVTIMSTTSGAGGVTFTTPNKMGLQSAEDLKNEVKELYGGRCAELILFDNNPEKVTTGASNDIERATDIIKQIIAHYGMTESFGLLNLSRLKASERTIMEEEIKLSKQLEQEALELLNNNKDKLIVIAENLLEKEILYENDLDEIIFK